MKAIQNPLPSRWARPCEDATCEGTLVEDLAGAELLRAAGKALGDCGPIDIEAVLSKERIRTQPMPGADSWLAQYGEAQLAHDGSKRGYFAAWGVTLQEAVLRCVVLRALGPRVRWPAEGLPADLGCAPRARRSIAELRGEIDAARDSAEPASAECVDLALTGLGQAESYQRDLLRLVQAARDVAGRGPHHLVHEVQAALEQFEPWLEQDGQDDARAMGWVDSQGRP